MSAAFSYFNNFYDRIAICSHISQLHFKVFDTREHFASESVSHCSTGVDDAFAARGLAGIGARIR